ncbi:MAG: cellulase family glycosylhydrolase, partial [Chloroflexota bacterium]
MLKSSVVVSLLLLAAVDGVLLLSISSASQYFPLLEELFHAPSTQPVRPSLSVVPSENLQTPTPIDHSSTLHIPLVFRTRMTPDVRSPFSVQIAALHQVSLTAESLQTQLNANAQTKSGSSGDEFQAYQNLASAIKDSGADWVRLRIEWELIEAVEPVPDQPPVYDWQYHDDNIVKVADTGVRIIATIADSPTWAAETPCAPIYPERLNDYARFLRDLVTRYKAPPYNIQHWELINEPDSDRYSTGHLSGVGCWAYDGDRYAQTLVEAFQAIKEADPQAKVLMGGLAYDWFFEYGGPFYRYFSDDVMNYGGGQYIDALNLHFFTDFRAEWDRWNPQSQDRLSGWLPAPTCGVVDNGQGTAYEVEGFDVVAKISHFRNRMNACFGVSKPIWLTEVAGHGYTDDQTSLIEQARYVIQVYARALSTG